MLNETAVLVLSFSFVLIQGGPGGSSTGFGNFMEIGPQDVDLKPRNTTWVSDSSSRWYARLLVAFPTYLNSEHQANECE